ncbi:MAG: ATP-dependent endonuclease [bacterium]|nr:ATP-dependent endonuclease [bacterium]
MRVQSIHVKNYRCIREATLSLDSLTALVGRNGSGKSAFLSALELFYKPEIPLTEEDFYCRNVGEPIEITVTYGSFEPAEQEEFAKYMRADELPIVGLFRFEAGKARATYHGTSLQHPAFAEVRRKPKKSELRNAFNTLCDDASFPGLTRAKSADEALRGMEEWELEHPESCVPQRDDGQFFGWTNVGQGYLRKHTQLIRIPAVHDASEDANEGRGSAITELVNLVVRRVLTDHPKIEELKREASERFAEIMEDDAGPQLDSLADDLSQTLRTFVPDAAVALRWSQWPGLQIPQPQTDVRVHEDGYMATVTRTGHGLQRALVFTLLQHLAAVRRADEPEQSESSTDDELVAVPATTTSPDLVLAIDEPELYQHPNRQRHLAEVFLQLSEGEIPGVAASTQVLYTTHSPLFVRLDRFDDIRVVRKSFPGSGQPGTTFVRSATLDTVAKELEEATDTGNEFTAETLKPRLQSVMTPIVNEGFFADVVVLVEGDSDRAAIERAARAMKQNFVADGIAIIPCGGKDNLDRPLIVFRGLGIPTYVVWDGDKTERGHHSPPNQRLRRILEMSETEPLDHVGDQSACFEEDLNQVIRDEIDETHYNEAFEDAYRRYGLTRDDAEKKALVVERIVEDAVAHRSECETIKAIVSKIVMLREDKGS